MTDQPSDQSTQQNESDEVQERPEKVSVSGHAKHSVGRIASNWHLIIAGLTLMVLVAQLFIYYRQANIMEQQSQLLERQTAVFEDQRNMAVRPTIYTEVLSNDPSSPDRTGPWIIQNRGETPVRNLSIGLLHFKKFNAGWLVLKSTEAFKRAELAAQDSWTIDLDWLPSMVQNIELEGLVPQEGLEFVILMLQFERSVDGKRYVYVEPFHVQNGVPRGLAGNTGMSGALANICEPEAELVHEYFRRQPSEYPLELYNLNYLLGYSPTGCLGKIKWLNPARRK